MGGNTVVASSLFFSGRNEEGGSEVDGWRLGAQGDAKKGMSEEGSSGRESLKRKLLLCHGVERVRPAVVAVGKHIHI